MYDKIQGMMRNTHWRLLQGSQLLITMSFQEHGISSQVNYELYLMLVVKPEKIVDGTRLITLF